MITFGRKLKHLRQKNHLTQKELGIALGFPEDSADVRIAQYEADARKPRDEILAKMAKILYVPIDVLTVPVLSEPREYDAASFWMHELAAVVTAAKFFGRNFYSPFISFSASSLFIL